jgi:hypothetical protein
MDEPKVRGVVHHVEEIKTYGQRGFQKRLVVLEREDGRFKSYIPLEFVQASIALTEQFKVGDDVEVTYRLGGRKWQPQGSGETKYFLSAEALDVRVYSGDAGSAGEPRETAGDRMDDDDIPF